MGTEALSAHQHKRADDSRGNKNEQNDGDDYSLKLS
jgi:hypothetical protein